MEKITFNVQGMHCKSCGMLIQDALEELAGVESVETTQKEGTEEGTVSVEYDSDKVNVNDLKEAVKKEGYSVK